MSCWFLVVFFFFVQQLDLMIFISIGQCRTNFNPAIVWRLFKNVVFFLTILTKFGTKKKLYSSGMMSCLNIFSSVCFIYIIALCSSFSLDVLMYEEVEEEEEKKLSVTACDRWFFFYLIQLKILWSLDGFYICEFVTFKFLLFCIGAWTFGSNFFFSFFFLVRLMRFVYYSFRLLFRFRKHFLIRIYFRNNAIFFSLRLLFLIRILLFIDLLEVFFLSKGMFRLWFFFRLHSLESLDLDGNEVKYFLFCQFWTVIDNLLFIYLFEA